MASDESYSNLQAPSGSYASYQQPGSHGGGAGGGTPAPAPVIHVHVNAKSRIKPPALANLVNRVAGLPKQFIKRIKFDRQSGSIEIPDLSGDTAVAGQEWIFDLGAAGDEWEVTTGELVAVLDGQTYYELHPDLQEGEERGREVNSDPDESLVVPPYDVLDISKNLMLGLTVPSKPMLSRNKAVPARPPPEICRLSSGRSLVIIADRLVVRKRDSVTNQDRVTTKPLPIGGSLQVMSLMHELSAHASYFQLGKEAGHHTPPDPANHPPDRNKAQVEANYTKATAADLNKLEKQLQKLIVQMHKLVR